MSTIDFEAERAKIRQETEEAIAQLREAERLRLEALDRSEALLGVAGVGTPTVPPKARAPDRPVMKSPPKKRKRRRVELRPKIRKAVAALPEDDFVRRDIMPALPAKTNPSSVRSCLTRMAKVPRGDIWLKRKGRPYEPAIFTRKRPQPQPIAASQGGAINP